MTHRPIALATSSAYAPLTDDDQPLIAALEARGLAAEPAVWNDAAVDWSRYAGVLLRSTWDYHLEPGAFLDWALGLAGRGARLANPPEIVRWNADKRYLLELAARGVRIVPTEYVEPAGPFETLAAIAERRGWSEVVVKPAISATAHLTWRARAPFAPEVEAKFRAACAAGSGLEPAGVLVQRFQAEIESAGEWSLIFFAGRFSHGVVKRVRAGEYRVQSEWGGTWTPAAPEDALIGAARAVLSALPFPPSACLYARVDGVIVDGAFQLMELELIEPALFLAAREGAAERFADVVAARAARLARCARPGATARPDVKRA